MTAPPGILRNTRALVTGSGISLLLPPMGLCSKSSLQEKSMIRQKSMYIFFIDVKILKLIPLGTLHQFIVPIYIRGFNRPEIVSKHKLSRSEERRVGKVG